jgi:hypothetical protein
MIRLQETGADAAIARFGAAGAAIRARLAIAIEAEAAALQRAVHDLLPGDGPLAGSFRVTVEDSGDRIAATIGSPLDLARWIAEGTRPHAIEAKAATVLRFIADGKTVYAKRVEHPGTRPHPFLDQALDDRREAILARLAAAVGEAA